ncbi:MAG: hypothetical protein ACE147_12865 [Candidatus Methylomirabilales bacterium]
MRWSGLLPALLGALLCVLGPDAVLGGAPGVRFDRRGVEADLARPPQGEPTAALQGRLQRLAEAYAALDLADLPPEERRALGERILTRMAEVGLLLRPRGPDSPRASRAGLMGPWSAWMTRFLQESSGLLVLMLGGLVICFALGNLAGYRRGARQASYYGEGDPRIRFVARPAARPDPRAATPRVTVDQIRRRLQQGQWVLLQLGYEIEAARRANFLAAVGRMQEALEGVEGQTFTVWEDPRHSNRFYECLECRDLRALERLLALNGPLQRLAGEVEACRPANGWVVRRALWGLSPHAPRDRSA